MSDEKNEGEARVESEAKQQTQSREEEVAGTVSVPGIEHSCGKRCFQGRNRHEEVDLSGGDAVECEVCTHDDLCGYVQVRFAMVKRRCVGRGSKASEAYLRPKSVLKSGGKDILKLCWPAYAPK